VCDGGLHRGENEKNVTPEDLAVTELTRRGFLTLGLKAAAAAIIAPAIVSCENIMAIRPVWTPPPLEDRFRNLGMMRETVDYDILHDQLFLRYDLIAHSLLDHKARRYTVAAMKHPSVTEEERLQTVREAMVAKMRLDGPWPNLIEAPELTQARLTPTQRLVPFSPPARTAIAR